MSSQFAVRQPIPGRRDRERLTQRPDQVDAAAEQMVFAEATLALPLLAAYGYHNGAWKQRPKRQLARLLES